MRPCVVGHIGLTSEWFSTIIASIWLLSCVCLHVTSQGCFKSEYTEITHVFLFFSVSVPKFVKIRLSGKTFPHIRQTWGFFPVFVRKWRTRSLFLQSLKICGFSLVFVIMCWSAGFYVWVNSFGLMTEIISTLSWDDSLDVERFELITEIISDYESDSLINRHLSIWTHFEHGSIFTDLQ